MSEKIVSNLFDKNLSKESKNKIFDATVDGRNFASKFKPKYKEIQCKNLSKDANNHDCQRIVSKISKIFRKRPNASERAQTHPNASERIRTGPNRSEHVRKLRKTCENVEKPAKMLKIQCFF